MSVIQGSGEVPVIVSAHHDSHDFGEYAGRVALTPEQQIRFSDYGTADTAPLNGLVTLVSERSRALGDLNRNPDDPGRFQDQDYGKPQRHDIWKPGQGLTEDEKAACQHDYHDAYHNKIIELLAAREEPTFVMAWDNTAHYEIGADSAGKPVVMKPFILSNRGREYTAEPTRAEKVSCDPYFLHILANTLRHELDARRLPSDVYLNLVYRGGYICRRYSSWRNQEELNSLGINAPVQSFQIEYDTAITHNQQTLEPLPGRAEAVRASVGAALAKACGEYLLKSMPAR